MVEGFFKILGFRLQSELGLRPRASDNHLSLRPGLRHCAPPASAPPPHSSTQKAQYSFMKESTLKPNTKAPITYLEVHG